MAAFERAHLPAKARSRPALRLVYAGAAGSLIAAAILIAWALLRRDAQVVPPRHGGQLVEATDAPTSTLPLIDLEPGDVERLVTWQAIDEGPRVIQPSQPVRRVRLEAMEQIRWADPELGITFRLAVPQEQVILVRQQSF